MYKYLHDPAKRTVYKFPARPNVSELTDANGRRKSWFVEMEILITRADNKLVNGRWQYDIRLHPSHSYAPSENAADAEFYFLQSNEPNGTDISEVEYNRLQSQYEAEAKAN